MRFLLALLLAAFALPAAAPAACHGGSTPHAMKAMPESAANHGDAAPDRKAVALHGCIGCIPPSAWTAVRIDDVLPAKIAMPIGRAAVFDLGRTAAPALRPPRTA
ncbi:hypothetical protein [Sphingomonas sp. M1A8_2b]